MLFEEKGSEVQEVAIPQLSQGPTGEPHSHEHSSVAAYAA